MKQRRIDSAIDTFRGELNCAQSVLAAYAGELRLDRQQAIALSGGFGSGMARLQGTCGAVSGASMVFGVYSSLKYADIREGRERSYVLIQQFAQAFQSIHGTLECRNLLNCDLRTEEGQAAFKTQGLKERVCEKCIADSIGIIERLIELPLV